MSFALLVAMFLCGYLPGSIPFGVLIARAHGIDLRQVGSGNIGATNAARALGRAWGVVVLVLDAAKAAVPMLLVGRFQPMVQAGGPWTPVVVGAGAFVGHLWPIFFRLRGGKGVATAFGAFLVLQPAAALAGLLTYALVYGATRISSVGSLAAALLFPLWLYLLQAPPAHMIFAAMVLALILWRHRSNIARLVRRREPRL
ncbi:MAG: glycerol-3-phosphate 1-O-acyltransferase PlsY [Myxococcales bacterium]|nr:glycerol-3-phosphate 1-O-acyltransferase PlsY [Myxococcota bacterium]MDW8283630.1 glycerol-3-phosphate 1-O-acyltransferase PlsY [Myxococcales bacterium]